MSCWVKILLISGCLVGSFTIALAISAVYIYNVEKYNLVTAECTVKQCTFQESQCPINFCTGTGSNRRCNTYYSTCYFAIVTFTLNTTQREYVATDTPQYASEGDADGRCNYYVANSIVTCYYDMRSPENTLGLSPNKAETGGIVAIVIFTAFDAIFLVIFLLAVFFSPKPNIGIPTLHLYDIIISSLVRKKKRDNIEVDSISNA